MPTPAELPPSALPKRSFPWGALALEILFPLFLFVILCLCLGWTLKPESLALLQTVLATPDMSTVGLLAMGAYAFGLLVVGTFSTARDGEMLGAEWGSIWLPVRVTLGAGLLMPSIEIGNGVISPLAASALWLIQLAA